VRGKETAKKITVEKKEPFDKAHLVPVAQDSRQEDVSLALQDKKMMRSQGIVLTVAGLDWPPHSPFLGARWRKTGRSAAQLTF
jgi:hypothetical protein